MLASLGEDHREISSFPTVKEKHRKLNASFSHIYLRVK